MNTKPVFLLISLQGFVTIALASSQDLPKESTLPARIGAIVPGRAIPELPSESVLPNPEPVHSRNQSRTSLQETRTSPQESSVPNAEIAVLPSEAELPAKAPDSTIVSNPSSSLNVEVPNRGELETELFIEEGETTPWPRLIQDGHSAAITAICFSPDGNTLYSSGRDKLVHVWAADEKQDWTHRDTVRWQIGRGPGGNVSSLLATKSFLFIGGYGVKAGREIGVIDRNALTTLRPLLNTSDLSAKNTEILADLSSDDETSVLAADSVGGLERWDFNRQSGQWTAMRLRDSAKRRSRFAPAAIVGKSSALVSEQFEASSGPTYRLELLNTADGTVLERLKHEAPISNSHEVIGAMLAEIETATAKRLTPSEKEAFAKKIIPASGTSCTKLACSPTGKFVSALDDAGWMVVWELGKGMVLKYRQSDVINSVVQNDSTLAFTCFAWADSDQSFFVGENNKKTGRGRIQKWTLNAAGQFRIENSKDLDRPPNHLLVKGQRLANDSGTQIQLRNANDLTLTSDLGRNSFRAPKQIQWNSGGNIGWKWNDITGTELAMTVTTNEIGESRLQLMDASQRQWLPRLSVPGGELPQYDATNTISTKIPGGDRVTLELDIAQGESMLGRYGPLSASCWILDANAKPVGIAASFVDGAEIWVFGFPMPGERVCPLWRVFRGHEDTINAMQCSQDGRFLISSGQDRRICIWPMAGWDAARRAKLDPSAHWGVTANIGPDAVELLDVAPEGPLYSRGVRRGDRIVKLAWTEPDPTTGKLKSVSTEAPQEIWTRLSRASFLTSFAFWYQRGGLDAPRQGFRRACQWEPLLTVTVNAEREWAAWTPLGFYDASFNGDQLFGWQLNRGPDKRPDFLPANRFRASLERPDVIGRLLDAGNIVKAFEKVAQQIPGGPIGMLSNLIALQPRIEIVKPTLPEPYQGNLIRLRAIVKVQKGQTISSSRAYVNGVVATNYRTIGPAQGTLAPDDPTVRVFALEWDASVPSDRRLKFQVFAETAEHNVGVGEIVMDHTKEKKESMRTNVYVLSAGVSLYRDPSLNLAKPSSNARRIAEIFSTNSIRNAKSNVSVMTDSMVTPVAWRSAIETMAERLQGNVSPDDVVLIYLTGHGLIDPKTQEYHYVTSRASARDLRAAKYEDCLSLSDLASLRKVACRKLVILDTCHSGAAQSQTPSRLKQAVRTLQNDQIFVMTSSEGNQLAFEDAFTEPLKEALDGRADVNKDKLVSLREAFQYVKVNMSKQSKPQYPTLGPTDLIDFAEFSIVRILPTEKPAKNVSSLYNDAPDAPRFTVASPSP